MNGITENILIGVLANLAFAIIVFIAGRIWYKKIKENYRTFLEQVITKAFKENVFEKLVFETALNNFIKSINSTNFIFIRCGNFNLSHQAYNREIQKVIKHDKIWDYHFHLISSASKNTRFLQDFFEFKGNRITSLKPIDTSQLAEINREKFDQAIESKLSKFNIGQSFIDVLIQGYIDNTEKFPSLNDIDLTRVTFSNITFFYPNQAYRIEKPYLQEIGTHLIETINELVDDSLCIREDGIPLDDAHGLEIGQNLLNSNRL